MKRPIPPPISAASWTRWGCCCTARWTNSIRSEEHTSELQSRLHLVCRLLLEKKNESTARVASIMANTNLSKQQQVSEIMRQMLTQAQTAGQYFTNDQIQEMTRKVSAEVDLVHQQTQNQRYGSSHIGATAKDISNVVIFFFTDVAPTVHYIFTPPVALRN